MKYSTAHLTAYNNRGVARVNTITLNSYFNNPSG